MTLSITHRYYPPSLQLPHYTENETSVLSLIAQFGFLWASVIAIALFIIRRVRPTSSRLDQLTFTWMCLSTVMLAQHWDPVNGALTRHDSWICPSLLRGILCRQPCLPRRLPRALRPAVEGVLSLRLPVLNLRLVPRCHGSNYGRTHHLLPNLPSLNHNANMCIVCLGAPCLHNRFLHRTPTSRASRPADRHVRRPGIWWRTVLCDQSVRLLCSWCWVLSSRRVLFLVLLLFLQRNLDDYGFLWVFSICISVILYFYWWMCYANKVICRFCHPECAGDYKSY